MSQTTSRTLSSKENPKRKSLVVLATAGTFLVLPATAAHASESGPVTSATVSTPPRPPPTTRVTRPACGAFPA